MCRAGNVHLVDLAPSVQLQARSWSRTMRVRPYGRVLGSMTAHMRRPSAQGVHTDDQSAEWGCPASRTGQAIDICPVQSVGGTAALGRGAVRFLRVLKSSIRARPHSSWSKQLWLLVPRCELQRTRRIKSQTAIRGHLCLSMRF